ncbi:Flp pilus assembly protein CpaB [Nocardioides ultimimeridianus]
MDRRRLLLVVAAVIAVLGVLLVFVYAHGADARAAKKYSATQVLVAKSEIEPGESFEDAFKAGKFELESVAASQELPGATSDSAGFDGKVALTTIYAHEQLIPAKFGSVDDVQAATTLPIPAGKLAISVLIKDDGRVGAFLRAGAQVSVIFTKLDLTGKPVFTRTLIGRVSVIAVGTTTTVPADNATDSTDSTDTSIQQLLTLAVTQKQAESVRFAEKDGELTAALLNTQSKVDQNSKPVTEPDVAR